MEERQIQKGFEDVWDELARLSDRIVTLEYQVANLRAERP